MLRYVDVLAVALGSLFTKIILEKFLPAKAKDGVTDDRVVFQACLS